MQADELADVRLVLDDEDARRHCFVTVCPSGRHVAPVKLTIHSVPARMCRRSPQPRRKSGAGRGERHDRNDTSHRIRGCRSRSGPRGQCRTVCLCSEYQSGPAAVQVRRTWRAGPARRAGPMGWPGRTDGHAAHAGPGDRSDRHAARSDQGHRRFTQGRVAGARRSRPESARGAQRRGDRRHDRRRADPPEERGGRGG